MTAGYQPAHSYLEQKMKTFPTLCDPDYEVDLEKDWSDLEGQVPIPLP